MTATNPFVRGWSCRSFTNDPDAPVVMSYHAVRAS